MFRTCLSIGVCTFLLTLSIGSLSAQDSGSGIVFTGCPPYVEGDHCDSMFYQVVAVDIGTGKQCPEMKYILVSGPGTINQRTGLWVFHPERDSLPPYYHNKVEIAAYKGNDTTTSAENCRFDVHFQDYSPIVKPRCGTRFTCLPGDTEVVTIEITDVDSCDFPQIDSVTVSPKPIGFFEFDPAEWVIRFSPDPADSGMTFRVGVTVSSGRLSGTCFLYFDAFWPEATYSVRIGYQEEVYQGQLHDVPITLEKFDHAKGLGGFDLLVAYDAPALAFQRAQKGDLYDSCGWEYFTYRYGPYGNCDSACPSGLLRVIGMAETNNGPHHPSQACAVDNPGWVSDVPITLATMSFLVSNDRTLECAFVPIRFFWVECGDNTLCDWGGNELYLSSFVYDYGDLLVSAKAEYPTYFGAQDECTCVVWEDPTCKLSALRAVDFYNGGSQIACADSIDNGGDVNCNGLGYEIADAVMFSGYFVKGLTAFGGHQECSIAASDANADGKTLTVEDLIYIIRVIIGDVQPQKQPSANPAQFVWDTGMSTVMLFSADSLGAVSLIVEGEITPTLLADQMELKFGWDTGWTRILIYSLEAGQALASGEFVSISGATGIVSVEAATFDARAVTEIVSDITDVDDPSANLPLQFALHPNYPNPFNPTTTIQYDLPEQARVRITVYNMVGQVVRTLVDRQVSPGQHETIWDGRDDSGRPVSSGLYLYRMTARDFTQSRKMLLLK